MIRVLICGQWLQSWRNEVEHYLSRDREEYDQAVLDNSIPVEVPRLPRVYPIFINEAHKVGPEICLRAPHVIISIQTQPPDLLLMNYHDRLRWYHSEEPPTPEHIKHIIYELYLRHALLPHEAEKDQPLLSVFTPTYNTGKYLLQAYQSLTEQSYKNWEWVIVDDGSTDDTPKRVQAWASRDSRIRFFRPVGRNFGNIGRMKRYATGLCLGDILVELDHDDILTVNALDDVSQTFIGDPDLGFAYSNFAEFVEGGGDHYYPDWVDRGCYRRTLYKDRYYLEAMAYDVYGDVEGLGPVIKDMTIAPNHVRAFRRSELWRVGGYNPHLVMGDDFDLIIRMFCYSKIKHINKLLYLYRIHENTWARFNEFARFFLPIVVQRWLPEIDKRIAELKTEGKWLKEPQGVRGQPCEDVFSRPGAPGK